MLNDFQKRQPCNASTVEAPRLSKVAIRMIRRGGSREWRVWPMNQAEHAQVRRLADLGIVEFAPRSNRHGLYTHRGAGVARSVLGLP